MATITKRQYSHRQTRPYIQQHCQSFTSQHEIIERRRGGSRSVQETTERLAELHRQLLGRIAKELRNQQESPPHPLWTRRTLARGMIARKLVEKRT